MFAPLLAQLIFKKLEISSTLESNFDTVAYILTGHPLLEELHWTGYDRGRNTSQEKFCNAFGGFQTSLRKLNITRDHSGIDFSIYSSLEVLHTDHGVFGQAGRAHFVEHLSTSLRQLEVIPSFPLSFLCTVP